MHLRLKKTAHFMHLMQRWGIAGNAGKALRENASYEMICASAGWQIENCAHLLHYSQTDFFFSNAAFK